jgi:hypothetical protein
MLNNRIFNWREPSKRLFDNDLDIVSCLNSQLTARLLSRITKFPEGFCKKKLRQLSQRIQFSLQHNVRGIANDLKEWEKYLLLGRKTKHPKCACPYHKIIFHGFGRFDYEKKIHFQTILLSIHRSFKDS